MEYVELLLRERKRTTIWGANFVPNLYINLECNKLFDAGSYKQVPSYIYKSNTYKITRCICKKTIGIYTKAHLHLSPASFINHHPHLQMTTDICKSPPTFVNHH